MCVCDVCEHTFLQRAHALRLYVFAHAGNPHLLLFASSNFSGILALICSNLRRIPKLLSAHWRSSLRPALFFVFAFAESVEMRACSLSRSMLVVLIRYMPCSGAERGEVNTQTHNTHTHTNAHTHTPQILRSTHVHKHTKKPSTYHTHPQAIQLNDIPTINKRTYTHTTPHYTHTHVRYTY